MLTSLDEHTLLVFWTQLFTLLVLARALGFLCRRVGLPAVIGELGAGVILGPSLFGRLWEDGFEWFLPDSEIQSGALQGVAWMGAALLLVVTGFETDLTLIRRLGRAAFVVTAGSLLVPFVGGLGVGFSLPAVFLGDDATQTTLALFIAAALSVSSLAVVGKILSELGLMRRNFGQITVAAGMANDVVGWILLGVFAGIAASGEISIADVLATLIGVALFLAFALTVGQRMVDVMLRQVRRGGVNIGGGITVTLFVALGFGVITQWLGVEALLGMFLAGIVVARSRFQQGQVTEHIESITASLLAPLFFATAGLRVDLGLLTGEALGWAVVIIVVAIIAKFIGSYLGARSASLSHREGLALGSGLNARGALEIVIATVGFSLGVLSETAFAVVVLVPLVTSVFASIGLRMSVRGWEGTEEERERLDRERSLARNLVVNSDRLLLPTAGSPNSIVAAQVLHYAWPEEAPATVLTVGTSAEAELEPIRNVLYGRSHDERKLKTDDAVSAILAEARLGYGVIGLGAGDGRHEGRLLTPLLDEVISDSSIPVVIVRRARGLGTRLPSAFTRALVGVTGGRSSRAAQEVACNLSRSLGTELVYTHIVDRPATAGGSISDLLSLRRAGSTTADSSLDLAEKVMRQAMDRAAEVGVSPRTDVRTGSLVGSELVAAAGDNGVDMVILGAALRRLEGRPFLGYGVEHVLDVCDATVVVVLMPSSDHDDEASS